MAVRFNLFYVSPSTGEYLRNVIDETAVGVVMNSCPMSELSPEQVKNEADVYFIEYDEQLPQLAAWLESLRQKNGHAAIFLYMREATTETLLKAMRLGVQECFVGQIGEDDFHKALQRLLKARTNIGPGEKTQILAVLGCKGGVGATFIAVNLAQILADDRNKPVLLADLDLRASNVSSFLDIQPRYTILDVIENFDRIDPQYLQDIIHSSEVGIDVLPGPLRLEDSELIHAAQIEKVFHYIRNQNLYRWILLDVGDLLDEVTLKALEISDLVLLIANLTIPGLRDAKKIMEMLLLLDIGAEKIQLVANAHCKDSDIKLVEANKFLGQDFLTTLRFDHKAVVRSINEGQPLVKTLPRHRLSLDFAGLAEKLHPHGEQNGHRPWSLDYIKRLLHLKG